jgi:hypothetical protein
MNSSCGKRIHHPRTKPVIVEDTTCGVSLLTGTISGSNFAIPWPFEISLAGTGQFSDSQKKQSVVGKELRMVPRPEVTGSHP